MVAPAPGWWILGAAVLVTSTLVVWAAIRRYRLNAYRRAALVELAAIGNTADAASAAAVSVLLKRTALAAYPRAEVASLTGNTWLTFLDRTGSTRDFTNGAAAALAAAAGGGPLGDGAAIRVAARRWIKCHRGNA